MVRVTNAGKRNGIYKYKSNIKVEWNREKPVYKHHNQGNFIFWDFTWTIGSGKDLLLDVNPKKGK